MAISGHGGIETAVDTFGELLEEDLSNFYLGRMRDFSNQVQPIVIALAESDHNLTQTEIALKTFLPAKSIGTAMVRLEHDGIVRPVSDKKGKNTRYTLTDHLFRLWYQWRTSLRERTVIETIVEFLAIWYKKKELETWAGGHDLAGLYCKEAIAFRSTRRFHGYWEEFHVEGETYITEYLTRKDYHSLFETLGFLKECGLDIDDLMKVAINGIEKRGGLDEAEKYLCQKLERDKEDLEAQLELSTILTHKADYSRAEDVLRDAVELNPKDALTWKRLGITRLLRENYMGAEEALVLAVELNPKDVIAWKNLGDARLRQENYSAAEVAYRSAVELDPKNARAWRD